jgi:ABC-type tungstate transport system permease subunit
MIKQSLIVYGCCFGSDARRTTQSFEDLYSSVTCSTSPSGATKSVDEDVEADMSGDVDVDAEMSGDADAEMSVDGDADVEEWSP